MIVLLANQLVNDIFTNTVSVMVAFLYVIMGATLDFEVMKAIAKKPLGPLVGIVCQYLFMPLVSSGWWVVGGWTVVVLGGARWDGEC